MGRSQKIDIFLVGLMVICFWLNYFNMAARLMFFWLNSTLNVI